MAGTHRRSTIALIVCLVAAQSPGTLFASEVEPSSSTTPPPAVNITSAARTAPSVSRFTIDAKQLASHSLDLNAFEQRGRYRGRRGRWDDNRAAQTAIIIGGVASITGAALLVYANRPECRTNPATSGCGYGTKVVGGSVLSAGMFSVVAGAVTWR